MMSPLRDEVARLEAPLLARLGSAAMAFAVGGEGASREDRDAPGARRALVERRRSIRQRDRSPGRGGLVNAPTDLEAAHRGWAGLAITGRTDRGGAGSTAFYCRRQKARPSPSRRAAPDWVAVHRELKRKHVTLQILWDEYIARHPDGYRYSRFCELYRGGASRISATMRQTRAGGDIARSCASSCAVCR